MSFTSTKCLLYLIVGLLLLLYYKLRKTLNYWRDQGIPGEPPTFLEGNMTGVQRTRSFSDIWFDYYRKFKGSGPFAAFYWFMRPAVFVLDIELIKNILIKDFNKFTDRGFFANEEDDPLTGQLFLLDGSRWRNMRMKLSPTFTTGKMKVMFETVKAVGQEFVDTLASMITDQDGVVEVKDLLARYTTDVIGTCAFGLDCNSLNDPETEFRVMGRSIATEQRHGALGIAFTHSFPRMARKLHMKITPDHIEEFFLRIVRETVEVRERQGIRRNDFMDMLIDLKNNKLIKSEEGMEMKNLTIEEITAQAFVFFAAGFETSSSTMGFLLYELACHPAVQERVRDEINEVLRENQGEFTFECMQKLTYMGQVIAETLRLYTILPVLNREAMVDYVVPGHPKYVIKKGMPILIPIGAIHRDPAYYPNPDTFNPDNFTAEAVKQRDSLHWLPFGDGPRNCIGFRFGQMQMRVGLTMLLRHFQFSTCEQTPKTLEYDRKAFLVTANGGIVLKVDKL